MVRNLLITSSCIFYTFIGLISSHPQEGKPFRQVAGFAWEIQQGYSVDFKINNFGLPVKGNFTGLKGNVFFDPDHPESGKFEVNIQVNTINTGISKRDKDLMAAKYFDEATYPTIHFQSEKISKAEAGFMVLGTITIKGKPVKIAFPFTFSKTENTGTFRSTFTLHRKDFGIGDKGGPMGNDIDVELSVPVRKG